MLRSPIFYGVLTFVLCIIFFMLVLPAATCMDGWVSSSIGSQGACSHHGGVNTIPNVLATIFSFLAGLFVWRKAFQKREILKSPDNQKIEMAERYSKGIFSRVNYFLCRAWNVFVSFLKIVKILPYIGSNGWMLGILIVGVSIVFPPFCFVLYPIGIAALINNAEPENDFLISLD